MKKRLMAIILVLLMSLAALPLAVQASPPLVRYDNGNIIVSGSTGQPSSFYTLTVSGITALHAVPTSGTGAINDIIASFPGTFPNGTHSWTLTPIGGGVTYSGTFIIGPLLARNADVTYNNGNILVWAENLRPYREYVLTVGGITALSTFPTDSTGGIDNKTANFPGTFSFGTYAWILTPLGGGVPLTGTVEIGIAAAHSISLTPANAAIPAQTLGYTTVGSATFTVENTGTVPTGSLTVNINNANFVHSITNISGLAPGSSTTFTVAPNLGLAVGTHTAVVTVSGAGLSASSNVSFTVNQAAVTPAITLTPNLVTINNNNLTATSVVSGTAVGAIAYNIDELHANIELSISGSTIIVTGTRPAAGQAAITGTFPVIISRGGHNATLMVNVNLTPLPAQPGQPGEPDAPGQPGAGQPGTAAQTLTLNPNNIIINNNGLTATVTAGGTAANNITFNRGNLPAAVSLSASGSTITVTGTRPAAGQAAITGTFPVTVSRGGVNTTLTINVNLTPFAAAPLPISEEIIPAHLIFNDVGQGAWYHDYVSIVAANGLFQGTAPGIFSPQLNMTRAMFAQVLANLEGVNLSAYAAMPQTFGDVAQTAWYYPAVQWAASSGIIQGVGGGNFAPGTNVTREQMAVMLYRYVQINGIALPQGAAANFADRGNISYWAVDAVTSIQQAGIVQGRPDGRFDPQATATRAEVSAIFARFLPIVAE